MALLHVSDWNMQDKYFRIPVSILREFVARIKKEIKGQKKKKSWFLKEADMGKSWDWLVPQGPGQLDRYLTVKDFTVCN